MNTPLEIIMPLRNPGNVLRDTVASLLAQTDKRFGVLLSDNFSTRGIENFDEAERLLNGAGIAVKRVRPPRELKRIEHWNWAHAQAQSEWIKPLFAGELLNAAYAGEVLGLATKTKAHQIRCFAGGKVPIPARSTYLTPEDFLTYYPKFGNWMGNTLHVCYRRSAWMGAGGYAIHLPACADENICVRLALEAGVELLHKDLTGRREGDGPTEVLNRRIHASFETWLILRQARIYCLNNKLVWPKYGITKGVWKRYWTECEYPWNQGKKTNV